MNTTNQDIVGDRCVRNDRGDLATSDQEKHLEMLGKSITRDSSDSRDLSGTRRNLGPHLQIDEESVIKALQKMEKGMASGTSGVVLEMLASGDLGIERMTNLFKKIAAKKKVPED